MNAVMLGLNQGLYTVIAAPRRASWRGRVAGGAGAAVLWAAAWGGATVLDHHVDLANQAMLFVIASVVASIWLSAPAAFAFALACMLSFNWGFVPPRGSLEVDFERHAVLLAAMLAVSWLIAGLVWRLRAQATAARDAARWAGRLQALGEALRDSAEPADQARPVAEALADLGGAPAALMLLHDELPPADSAEAVRVQGTIDADERAGLWLCLRQSQSFGPGTGRHTEQPAWYLPLRSRGGSHGAALVRLADPGSASEICRIRAQALCDLLGVALQRATLARQSEAAREMAQSQGVRNALLASISHDYRTPLAVILGAASSLQDQGERLSASQRAHLATQIVDEVRLLSRMTDNTLQLARLDAPGVTLRLDWESSEEIVGTALAHARRLDNDHRVRARLEPGLPLLRCDAMLLSQLLDNLVDNALKYSTGPVELVVRHQAALPGETGAAHVVIAVRDRGAGVAPADRRRVFEVFQRGHAAGAPGAARGVGVGLAVCRAIARAHGGELRLRPRAHGGTSFELWLPVVTPPAEAAE
ncbi:sensor histidine kinase [Ideonella sp. YS5]|uniref:sensor histidine kinase n=1 Tax=Ideonella sp. YS5 TaxID=3453714 RepID=UPI003EE9A743